MTTNDKQREILKQLNDNRSKLSALFSLYNNSLILAEENRTDLMNFFTQLLDYRNDLSTLTADMAKLKKADRTKAFAKLQPKIKSIDKDLKVVSQQFKSSCNKYMQALQECGSLKTEYKHEVSELCKEFKTTIDDSTSSMIIKGYKQQVKLIRAILDRIELLISDYNIKKNKVEQDSERFDELYNNVIELVTRLKASA